MSTVLLPPGVNPIAVKYIISYHIKDKRQRGSSLHPDEELDIHLLNFVNVETNLRNQIRGLLYLRFVKLNISYKPFVSSRVFSSTGNLLVGSMAPFRPRVAHGRINPLALETDIEIVAHHLCKT